MRFETHAEPLLPQLVQTVRHYSLLQAETGGIEIARAAPVRPQQFLQLVLDGEHRLRNLQTGRVIRSPRASLIGMCSHRKYDLLIGGRLRVFFVQFQPGAVHAMTRRDMAALTDNCLDARAVFGPTIDALVDALAAAPRLAEQRAIADAWLAARPQPPVDEIAAIARRIRETHGLSGALSDHLSTRQFQRRFLRQIGVTPKVYARLCRLAAVIDMREAEPCLSWTELAYAGGYADQAHLTREFRSFVRAAPSRFRHYNVTSAAA